MRMQRGRAVRGQRIVKSRSLAQFNTCTPLPANPHPPRRTSHRTRGRAEISTDRGIALFGERINGGGGIKDNDEFSDLDAGLKPDTKSASTDCLRRAPAFFRARNENSGTASGTADEAGLCDRHNRHPAGSFHDSRRNSLLGNGPKPLDDGRGLIDISLLASRGETVEHPLIRIAAISPMTACIGESFYHVHRHLTVGSETREP
jgi:hypothetical protein